jgi:hypothetical protein
MEMGICLLRQNERCDMLKMKQYVDSNKSDTVKMENGHGMFRVERFHQKDSSPHSPQVME